jgi:tripartite-type tricarboxylate transporter receptor subunit TctC
VIRTLNAEMKDLLIGPEAQARFLSLGGEPAYGTPQEFNAFVRAEIATWARWCGARGCRSI